jgi:succinate-acetate transporter protein
MTQLDERWTRTGAVEAGDDMSTIERWQARAKAMTADPMPLGLLGFATATFALGSVIAGWWPQSSITLVIPVLLVFGGLTQFIAGMWAYAHADTLLATAFASFGAFNTTASVYYLLQHAGVLGATVSYGPLAIWIACFAFIAAVLALAALSRSSALASFLFALCVGYGLLSAGYFAQTPSNTSLLYHVGGWFLIVSAVLAFYTAAAAGLNSAFRARILPIGSPHEYRQLVRS